MARTFGGTTADVVADLTTGLPLAGDELTVWTAPEGALITGNLEDLDGNPITIVTTDTNGSFAFRINVDTWPIVHVRDSNGNWYRCVAEEIDVLAADAATDFPAVQAAATQAQADASDALAAVGRVAKDLGLFATTDQLTGVTAANAAIQAAIDDLPAEGGVLWIPAGADLLIDGATRIIITGLTNLTITGPGYTLRKNSLDGWYTVFHDAGSNLPLGYGSGVNNLIIENATAQGSFNDAAGLASVNLLTSNHGRRIRLRNCDFIACQMTGHTIDIAGCEDVVFEDCHWYGYRDNGDTTPNSEAVNIDNSLAGAGAAVAPYASGLACRGVRLVRCGFHPYTDPDTGITYPAPIPLGTHQSTEGQPTEDIYFDIFVEDPVVDAAAANPAVDNPYHRGLVHIPSVRHVRGRIHVKATDAGSIRAVQFQSASTGNTGDPNAPVVAAFTTPNPCGDIDVEVRVEGMTDDTSGHNPAVVISGLAAEPVKDVRIRVSADGQAEDMVRLYHVDNAEVDVQGRNAGAGVKAINSTGPTITGRVTDVDQPVILDNVDDFTVGPLKAKHSVTQAALVTYANGTDGGVIVGTRRNGYTNLTTGGTPTTVVAAGNA